MSSFVTFSIIILYVINMCHIWAMFPSLCHIFLNLTQILQAVSSSYPLHLLIDLVFLLFMIINVHHLHQLNPCNIFLIVFLFLLSCLLFVCVAFSKLLGYLVRTLPFFAGKWLHFLTISTVFLFLVWCFVRRLGQEL